LTPAGHDALKAWLAMPVAFGGGRNPLLVQVFFAGLLTDEELLALFQRAIAHCRAELAHLRLVPAQTDAYVTAADNPRESYCWLLTLECGIRMTEAHLAWLESVAARISAGELPPRKPVQP
jgi:hypothetical protein